MFKSSSIFDSACVHVRLKLLIQSLKLYIGHRDLVLFLFVCWSLFAPGTSPTPPSLLLPIKYKFFSLLLTSFLPFCLLPDEQMGFKEAMSEFRSDSETLM